MKTAKALGLSISQSILLRADKVTEWPLVAGKRPSLSDA
jgi:hypothetical protein